MICTRHGRFCAVKTYREQQLFGRGSFTSVSEDIAALAGHLYLDQDEPSLAFVSPRMEVGGCHKPLHHHQGDTDDEAYHLCYASLSEAASSRGTESGAVQKPGAGDLGYPTFG